MSGYYNFKMNLEIDIKNEINKEMKNKMKENIEKVLQQENIIPIAKVSIGWQPLFAKTSYYSNFKEIEDFYKENKECLKIVDNYGLEYTFDDFKIKLNQFKNEKNSRKHKENGVDCYLDESGNEFSYYLRKEKDFFI